MRDVIIALILSIAVEYEVPPHFALAIAFEENITLNPHAVHYNLNGSVDRGVFQLNSSWFNHPQWYVPEINIRAAMAYIRYLYDQPLITMWSQVAAAYNGGITRYNEGRLPDSAIWYAVRVMNRWYELCYVEHARYHWGIILHERRLYADKTC